MDIYSTEEQQAEAIKRFFRENGISLALGVIVGLGGLYGWKAYNQNQITTAEQASDEYTTLVQSDDVLGAADTFIKNNQDTSYATLAAFVAAKDAVDAKKLDLASEKLSWIVTNAQSAELKGDIYIAQGNKDQARTAYQAAADAGGLTTNPLLQIKLDDLAVTSPAA
jgi:predicted negative regulator of RcsB-dependent stress response